MFCCCSIPAGRVADRGVAGEWPAARSARIANDAEVDEVLEGVVALARLQHFGDEVAPGERVGRRHHRRSAARIVRSASPRPLRVEASRAQRVEHRVPVAADARRVAPGGGEADRGPGGVELAR